MAEKVDFIGVGTKKLSEKLVGKFVRVVNCLVEFDNIQLVKELQESEGEELFSIVDSLGDGYVTCVWPETEITILDVLFLEGIDAVNNCEIAKQTLEKKIVGKKLFVKNKTSFRIIRATGISSPNAKELSEFDNLLIVIAYDKMGCTQNLNNLKLTEGRCYIYKDTEVVVIE